MTPLLEAVLKHAARGWPIFPVQAGGKQPLIPKRDGGNGLHDATTDPDTITAWWTRWPDANIGVRTGVAFDALDVDGDEGVEELSRLLRAAHGHDDEERLMLPPGPISFTPNRGVHLLFAPTGDGNRAKFRPGLDYRGTGGYIVAPPSIGAAGRRYRWWAANGDRQLDRLSPAPGWLTAALVNRSPEAPPFERIRAGLNFEPLSGIDHLEVEARAVAATPEGNRNHRLHEAAKELSRRVYRGDLDTNTVVRVLRVAATAAGLGEDEITNTINSAFEHRNMGKVA